MSSSPAAAVPFQGLLDFFRNEGDKATPAEEFENFLNYDKEWVSAVKSALINQGFDTNVTMSLLAENRASYLARHPDDLKYFIRRNFPGDTKFCFTNKQHIQQDMSFLIAAGLMWSSNMQKIIENANGPGKAYFKMLQKKYDIKNGSTFVSGVITLPRIVRAFPGNCARLFHKKAVREIVPYDTFPGSTKPETHAICCPLLQSVCPFTLKAENNFHPVMLWVLIKFDDIFHRHGGQGNLMQLLSYYFAAYQSAALPEDKRLELFSVLGIIIKEETCTGQNWKLTDSAAQLAASCLSELDNMRKDDENHALLMNIAKTGEF